MIGLDERYNPLVHTATAKFLKTNLINYSTYGLCVKLPLPLETNTPFKSRTIKNALFTAFAFIVTS